ncbi:MAG: GspH/FimT family pseudopilin [Polaromonas sp.]|nr:GspH/FimT family pseudopilin [Polaromonas sp.]
MPKQSNLPAAPASSPESLLRKRSMRGFTLVELLVVIAILGILLGASAPWVGTFADSMRLTSQANAYLSALHLTRSEAIKRNSRMTVCKSADGLSCTEGGGWQQGWIIFHDPNNNAAKDDAEVMVHQSPALPTSFQLVGNLNVARYVSFDATGGTRLASGAFQAGTLTLCRQSASSGEARQIVINSAGRSRVQKVVLATCV